MRFEGTQSYVATEDLKVAVNAAVKTCGTAAPRVRSGGGRGGPWGEGGEGHPPRSRQSPRSP